MIKKLTIILAVILTARLGKIQYNNHIETWYDLNMSKVIANVQAAGIPYEYHIREDGVKMLGDWVIVASHPSVPKYSFIETSLGTGIVLDRHEMADKNLYDIATDWKE